MAYHDYFMRQIEDMGRMLGEMLFMKKQDPIPDFDEQGNLLESGLLYRRLCTMLDVRDVNGAENLLFEMLERYPEYDFCALHCSFIRIWKSGRTPNWPKRIFPGRRFLRGCRKFRNLSMRGRIF